MSYADFLAQKAVLDRPSGMVCDPASLPAHLFDWQRPIVSWGLERGRAGFFEDCGLGKTLQQLIWGERVPGRVLIVAPLAVAQQTVREGARFGIEVTYVRDMDEAASAKSKQVITNYEHLEKFDPSKFEAVTLDESSILKNFTGKYRNLIIDMFGATPWRSAWTATPAPNDYMELGNHAEFLGVMKRTEMLATFFVHDGGRTSQWRLKGHAEDAFWRWLASWAIIMRKPSDIGFDDAGFDLPPLEIHQHILDSATWSDGWLFPMPASTLNEQRKVKRDSIGARVQAVADLVNKKPGDPWVVWCELNDEGDELAYKCMGARQIAGSDTLFSKETTLESFSEGELKVLVTKPKIAGFGLNWQHCANMVFANITHSAEQFYQCIRRCWRFGQKRKVNVHIFLMDTEVEILTNIQRKEREAAAMAENMIGYVRAAMGGGLGATARQTIPYEPRKRLKLPEYMRAP